MFDCCNFWFWKKIALAKIRISQIGPKNCTNEIKKPKIRISHKIALPKYT